MISLFFFIRNVFLFVRHFLVKFQLRNALQRIIPVFKIIDNIVLHNGRFMYCKLNVGRGKNIIFSLEIIFFIWGVDGGKG